MYLQKNQWSKTVLKIQKQPPKVPYKKDVFKNFAKFTGKHLCRSLFSNKVASLRLQTLLNRWYRRPCFSREFFKIVKNMFFTEHLRATVSSEKSWTENSRKLKTQVIIYWLLFLYTEICEFKIRNLKLEKVNK